MKAIGKYIVIKEVKSENTKTSGGLMLTEENREDIRYREGQVINIGTDVVGVNNGDIVYYDKHAGHGIEWNDELFHVINLGDIVIVE
jgi:co-chaperonin GroES (HSP10)